MTGKPNIVLEPDFYAEHARLFDELMQVVTWDPRESYDYSLSPGALLYMRADVQAAWKNAIKKQENAGPRISLTWRAVQ